MGSLTGRRPHKLFITRAKAQAIASWEIIYESEGVLRIADALNVDIKDFL